MFINQITQGRKLTYGYDNRGNQDTKTVPNASDKTWIRTWDLNNRLTQEQKVKGTEVKTVTYKYDPFGRRIEKKFQQTKGGITETETTNYVYDNEDIVVEYFTTAGGTEKTFVTHGHGIDETLALERSGSYYFYHQDGLGSITHITNSAKAVVQSYTYDAYGMGTASTDFRNSYQHTGREYDWETATLYMRERTRDLMDGNFASKDPLGFAGGINLYSYVNGNVQNATDPWGLDVVQTFTNFSAGFGDALLLGAGSFIREQLDINSVDEDSTAYKTGSYTSLAVGSARLAYAGLAKGASLLASSGEAASITRNTLKNIFRLGIGASWRKPNLTKYPTDAALRAAAGRTNPYINIYGAGVAASGISDAKGCDK